MPFPLSLTGSFVVDVGPSAERRVRALCDATARWLRDSRAKTVTETSHAVSFTAGISRSGWNWDVLLPISRGIVEFEHGSSTIRVKYQLWFTELMVVATTMVTLLCGLPLLAARNLTTLEALTLFVGMWLWLCGGNYVIAWYRISRTLRRIVREQH
jgi:hypothetical protein